MILTCECIRVVLCVHSANVSCKSGLETEDFRKGIAVIQGYAASGVGLVWRDQFLHCSRPLGADIEDTVILLKVYTFRDRGLVCTWIYGEGHIDRSAAFSGVYLYHTAVKVSVFSRRDTGDDFYRLDIVDGNASGIHSLHSAERGVIAQSYTIDLYRCSES